MKNTLVSTTNNQVKTFIVFLLCSFTMFSYAQRKQHIPEIVQALKVDVKKMDFLKKLDKEMLTINQQGILLPGKDFLIRYSNSRNAFIIAHRTNKDFEAMNEEIELAPGIFLMCYSPYCSTCEVRSPLENPNQLYCPGACGSIYDADKQCRELITLIPEKRMEFQTPQGDWRPAIQ